LTVVWPRVSVRNNADTRVRWTPGGPSLYAGVDPVSGNTGAGGTTTADGAWQTPNAMSWFAITATSVADPKQFAEGRAFLINTDTDTDGETDALDMGGIAFSWFLASSLSPAHSTFIAPFVDNGDVSSFVDAMKGAWPVR
jgi:hypothetical protein